MARWLISHVAMAKARKRTETASPRQSTATPEGGANGRRAPGADVERDRIALRAYELYLARGGADGADFDDWIAAERELIGSIAPTGSDRQE